MNTVKKYTIEVSVDRVILDVREDCGREQHFVFLAPSRFLSNFWCVNAITVLDAGGTPIYEVGGIGVERHFLTSLCGTSDIHTTARSRLCVGMAECIGPAIGFVDDTAYAVAVKHDALTP